MVPSRASVESILESDPYHDPLKSVLSIEFSPNATTFVVLDVSGELRFYLHAPVLLQGVLTDVSSVDTMQAVADDVARMFEASLLACVDFWDVILLTRTLAAPLDAPAEFITLVSQTLHQLHEQLPLPLARMFRSQVRSISLALFRLVKGNDVQVVDTRTRFLLDHVVDLFEACTLDLARIGSTLESDLATLAGSLPSFASPPGDFAVPPTLQGPEVVGDGQYVTPPGLSTPLEHSLKDWFSSLDPYTAASLVPLIEWTLHLGLFFIANLHQYARMLCEEGEGSSGQDSTKGYAEAAQGLGIPLVSFLSSPDDLTTLRKAVLHATVFLVHPSLHEGAASRLPWQFSRSKLYAPHMYTVLSRVQASLAGNTPVSPRVLGYLIRNEVSGPLLPASTTDLNQLLQRLDLFPPLLGVLELSGLSSSAGGGETKSIDSKKRSRSASLASPSSSAAVLDPTSCPPTSSLNTVSATDIITRSPLNRSSEIHRQCSRCHALSEASNAPQVLWYQTWSTCCPCGGRWLQVSFPDSPTS